MIRRTHRKYGGAFLCLQMATGNVPRYSATGLRRMFSSGRDGSDWLDTFINFEQKGVPKNAGVDCEEGFSLVRLL